MAVLRVRPLDMVKDVGTGRNIQRVQDRIQEVTSKVKTFKPLQRIRR